VDQACGEVESTKPVSDLFTPATGEGEDDAGSGQMTEPMA
jgi:hypothetical protein